MTAVLPEERTGEVMGYGEQRRRRAWLGRAECRDADPELFFGEDEASVREARKWCLRCPVSADCLEQAMEEEGSKGTTADHNMKYRAGVRGGLTGAERWELAYPERAAEIRGPRGGMPRKASW